MAAMNEDLDSRGGIDYVGVRFAYDAIRQPPVSSHRDDRICRPSPAL